MAQKAEVSHVVLFGLSDSLTAELERVLNQESRVKVYSHRSVPGPHSLNLLKTLHADVDFCVSYLRLRHHLELPTGSNVAEQVAALGRAGLVTEEDARARAAGAAFLRSLDHAVRLVTGKAALGLPEHLGHAEAVESLARRWGLVRGEETLAKRLRETQQEVRYTYRRLVGAE